MTLNAQVAPLDVTNHPAQIVQLAQEDVVSWNDILTHKTVIAQGTLPSSSQRGALLFSSPLTLTQLHSTVQKSIIMHLAEMFAQWHGTLVFELVTTLPYFVATKVVFAFLPSPFNSENATPATLAGMQNSIVFNPSDQTSISLRIPFVSPNNWSTTSSSYGTVTARLLEPIVSSLQLEGGLPWTLFVSADPSDFRFRYIIPPYLPNFDDNPSTPGPSLGDQTLARSYSTKRLKLEGDNQKANSSWPLVQQPQSAPSLQYQTMLLIPRSRIEFVMQKIRGQFPTADNFPTTCVADMFDVPASSLASYSLITLPPVNVLYPYLVQPFLYSYASNVSPTPNFNYPVNMYQSIHSIKLYLSVPPSAATILENQSPSLYISFVYPDDGFGGPFLFTYETCGTDGTHAWHVFSGRAAMFERIYMKCAMVAWATLPESQTFIINSLSQVDQAPPEVTHLALYSTMPPELAAQFNDWLITSTNTSPPAEALYYSIAFSPNQAALAFNAGRFNDGPQQRGIVWKLFKLFKGDETKWWAWLVKGLDLVVDCLIGAFLGRAGTSYVVPITPDSGFRVEAVGVYDKTEIINYTERVALEYIAPAKSKSVVSVVSAQIAKQQRPHLLARSKTPLRTQSKSPVNKSRNNSKFRAKHPSPRKNLFRSN